MRSVPWTWDSTTTVSACPPGSATPVRSVRTGGSRADAAPARPGSSPRWCPPTCGTARTERARTVGGRGEPMRPIAIWLLISSFLVFAVDLLGPIAPAVPVRGVVWADEDDRREADDADDDDDRDDM